MLKCRSCGVQKPVEEYYVRPKSGQVEKRCNSCVAEKNRQKKLRQRYGITPVEYDALYAKQDGCCAICNTHQSQLPATLAVDHCHETGEVRGLLCFECNTGIGKLKDNYELILKAAQYIRSSSN